MLLSWYPDILLDFLSILFKFLFFFFFWDSVCVPLSSTWHGLGVFQNPTSGARTSSHLCPILKISMVFIDTSVASVKNVYILDLNTRSEGLWTFPVSGQADSSVGKVLAAVVFISPNPQPTWKPKAVGCVDSGTCNPGAHEKATGGSLGPTD